MKFMQRRTESELRAKLSMENAKALRESKWVADSKAHGARITVEVRFLVGIGPYNTKPPRT